MTRSGFLILSLLALSACDSAGGDSVSVRGRVVDDVTGQPLNPGPAVVSVTAATFMGPTETPLQAETGPDGRFDLSGEVRPALGEFGLGVASAGRIEYPGADTSAAGILFGSGREAYFRYRAELPRRSNVATIRLLPTCLTLGAVRLSRPLRPREQLRFRLAPIPAVVILSSEYSGEFAFQGSPGPDEVTPDSLRLFGVGGRAGRLEWVLGQYNPPTGNGQQGIARGEVSLATCPHHGVLRYAAAIPLPR